ncbi:ATP-dependent DNA ligase [Agromyces albus]|uniref:ATP-dependent DNA ligase n=1 Tax=Agromyces albus TaxID=205332 RepID=A0A4Q2L772_9MICO|nr:ATP-dependent DNA ligase [Agromyces albus]
MPASLRRSPELALARAIAELPGASALPGGCFFEPKWDGFRIALVRDAEIHLWSRQGKDLTRYFPELAVAAGEIPEGCVVDGEAVVWNAGRLDFDALQRRLSTGAAKVGPLAYAQPASYVAFDVLAIAGRDVRGIVLQHRRALLEELASTWTPPLNLSPVTRDYDEARDWLATMPATGIEGIVVKGAAQRYEGGQRQWLKVKHRDTIDVIAGAVIGPMSRPEAVVVGLPVAGELRIAGRSTPLPPHVARTLSTYLQPPEGEHPWPGVVSPGAVDRFNTGRDPVRLTLVQPLVIEVSADVALSGRSFRHAVRFIRIRPELDVAEVEWPAT